ncbi:MAG: RES domain-containing protein [Alphaproteobacteria bacterium]|nr:RES domain-containing protein [Alphaproteobacteria bacterium]
MAPPFRKARDVALMDRLYACARERFIGEAWRVVRQGRDPLIASASQSRWCDGTFDVLYTSLHRDGAIAEIDALLRLQPVFPSKIMSQLFHLEIHTSQTLRLADMDRLASLGVDTARYRERDYTKTAEIAETAFFIGFDGLIAPSARFECNNLVLFTDRFAPGDFQLKTPDAEVIDWAAWRKKPRQA